LLLACRCSSFEHVFVLPRPDLEAVAFGLVDGLEGKLLLVVFEERSELEVVFSIEVRLYSDVVSK
jgi:hypothetical protein